MLRSIVAWNIVLRWHIIYLILMHLNLHLDNTHVAKINHDRRVATLCSTRNKVIIFRTWFGLVAETFLMSIERELLSHSKHFKGHIWIWIKCSLKCNSTSTGYIWMVTRYFGTLASTLMCAIRLAHTYILKFHTILNCIHYHGNKLQYIFIILLWLVLDEVNKIIIIFCIYELSQSNLHWVKRQPNCTYHCT